MDRGGGHRQNRQCVDGNRLVGASRAAVGIRHLHRDRVVTHSRPAHILLVVAGARRGGSAVVRPFIAVQGAGCGCERHSRREVGAVLADRGIAADLRFRHGIHRDFHRLTGNTGRVVVHHRQ